MYNSYTKAPARLGQNVQSEMLHELHIEHNEQ